jgi:flagellum-specific peptidoglycan hydrolase FlgJ
MPSQKQLDALTEFASAAVRSERLYGIPAELTVAQAILESGWGTKMPGNNCFGIKANSRVHDSVAVKTHEVIDGVSEAETDEFAAYASLDPCFEDHAILLSQRSPYDVMLTKFQQTENLPVYVEEVATKYATDPNYAKTLLSIISMRSVQDALRVARAVAPEATP